MSLAIAGELVVSVRRWDAYSHGLRIEPVRDVSARREHNWITLGLFMVIVDEFCNVVNLIEQGDPAVVVGVVLRFVLRRVKVSHFVWLWVVTCNFFRQLLGVLCSRRRHSCSHFLCFNNSFD